MTFLNSDEHKTKLLGVFSSQKPPLEHFPVQSKEHACIYSASSLISITEMLPPPSMVFLCACKCFRIIHSHSHQRWFQCTQAGAKAPCWTPGVKWVICSKSCFLSSVFVLSYSFPWSTWRWDVPELFSVCSQHTHYFIPISYLTFPAFSMISVGFDLGPHRHRQQSPHFEEDII